MGISFGSINTGLPKDIVQQLMAAERIPINKMEERKAKINEKSKLVNQLIDLMTKLQGDLSKNNTAKGLRELSVVTNNDLVDVTVDKDLAETGEYRLEVMELAQKSSAMTSGFEDPDKSNIGVGFIQYTLPSGEKRDLYVDSNHSSLKAVANLINNNSGIGMKAKVINDGTDSDRPWHLLMSVDGTGNDNFAEFPYFYFVDGDDDFYLETQREAHNAKVRLDGIEIELPSNKASDLIPGLTIDLKKAKPGEEFPLKITENIKAITEKMNLIIEKINAVLEFIHKQNSLDEKTDTSRTLGGDLSLQSIEGRIRDTIFTPIYTTYGYQRFGDLGVIFQKNGMLELDTKKFESIIAKNYSGASQILTGALDNEEGVFRPGFLENFNRMVDGILRRPDGVLPLRKEGLQSTISQIDRDIERKQRILDQKEVVLKDKFSRLEGTISRIKGQGAGLASMASGAENVAQLGEPVG